MRKILFILAVLLLIIFCITLFSFYIIAKNLNYSPQKLFNTITTALELNKDLPNHLNFIILGLDPRDDSLEKSLTTDTIIFTSLNTATATVNLVSIPRDLWVYRQHFKVNQFYPLALTQLGSPFDYLRQQFSQLLNQPLSGIIVINTNALIELVRLIDGVDVFLDQELVDTQYPNPDYLINPSSKISKYITIHYPQGLNHLDADNVTPFIRSRKSSDSVLQGGTDLGRIRRQQLLIEAIVNKLKTPRFYRQPYHLLALYHFWQSQISTDITDPFLLASIFKLNLKLPQLTLNRITLPDGSDHQKAVFYPSPKLIERQWVFLPSDPNYYHIQSYIINHLR